MKIRNGFVSNSSTTSFCIYGISVDGYDEMEEIEKLENKVENCEHYDLSCINAEPLDEVFIGKRYLSMHQDETRREFEDKVEEGIKSLGFDTKDIGPIELAWRDG